MQSFTPPDPLERNDEAILDTLQHLRRHGAALCSLLEVSGEFGGVDALCNLHGTLSTPFPDQMTVKEALGQIEQALQNQTPSDLDRIVREHNFHASVKNSWHLAKVSGLLTLICSS